MRRRSVWKRTVPGEGEGGLGEGRILVVILGGYVKAFGDRRAGKAGWAREVEQTVKRVGKGIIEVSLGESYSYRHIITGQASVRSTL